MKPSPKSFILDLLSTLRRGTMPVGALVEAGELFGIRGNNTRVTLARLLAAGQVGRDERGRYRLGTGARPVAQRLAAWRDADRRTARWDGSWIGVYRLGGTGRTERRGRERALRLLGFESLQPTLDVRPNNLRGSTDELRAELRSIGLPAADLVCELRDFEDTVNAAARRLWDTDALRRQYHAHTRELRKSAERLATAPAREAMVESFLVGGRVLRDLVLDPRLPKEICADGDRLELHEEMKQYDRLGRAAWAKFLSGYDVPHVRVPRGARLTVTPGLRSADLGTRDELRP